MALRHRLEDPLVPGMAPTDTRLLAVGGDATRLGRLVTNLRLRGYQVTGSTDPAAAMAALRQDGLQQGFNFDLVMVDNDSEYPGSAHAALNKLFEFAIREPRLCAYAINGDGTFGPLEMKDIHKYMKPIYTVASNGPNSPKGSLNGPPNTSPSTTASTITNFSLSGQRAERRNKRRTRSTDSQEVEQDPKKPRFIWAGEPHKKFLEACDKLEAAGEKPVPKKILHVMDDPTLTRANIASHLQKHRVNLLNEGRAESPRRSHSRTRHHRSAPQASFPSRNMPSQQQDPPTMMQPDLCARVYTNYGMNAHTMLQASTKSDMQDSRQLLIRVQTFTSTDKSNESMLVDDAPSKDMHLGADDPKQNSCVGNSDGNSLPKDFSEILDDEPNPSWDTEFLFSSND